MTAARTALGALALALVASLPFFACGTGTEQMQGDRTPPPLSSTSFAPNPRETTSALGVAPPPSAASATLPAKPARAPLPSLPPNAPDPTSFDCSAVQTDPATGARKVVAARCVADKQSCCVQGMMEAGKCVDAPAASATETNVEKVFAKECNEPPAGGKSGAVVSRCDESEDCGANEVCCKNVSASGDYVSHQCLPRGSAAGGPCPGDELCIAGGPDCRTEGATCVEGLCVKAFKDPAHVCATTADCLSGQHCYLSSHPPPPPRCGRFGETTCEKVEDCQGVCSPEAKVTCRKRTDPRAPGFKWNVQFCECN